MGCGHRAEMTFDELRLPDENDLRRHPTCSEIRLLDIWKPGREGNAYTSAGTGHARLW
jgi:hypothetical protein